MGLGLLALRGVERRCLEPLEAEGAELATNSVDRCLGAEPLLVAAGVGSGVMLLASGGLAAGGGWESGLASGGAVDERARRSRIGVGAALLSVGLVGVLTSAFAFRISRECDSAGCFREARVNDLVIRSLAGGAAASGGAILGSIGARGQGRRYARVMPQLRRGSVGLGLSGSF